MDKVYFIVLIPMVYLAAAVFVIGITARILKMILTPGHSQTLRIHPEKRPVWLYSLYDAFLLPTVRKHNPLLWFFLMLFHLCLFLLIIGHIELIGDVPLFQVIPHAIFL